MSPPTITEIRSEDSKQDSLCVDREAEGESVVPTLERELKPLPHKASIDVTSDAEDIWPMSLTSCGAKQANSPAPYDTGKQIIVDVILDSESPYLNTDWGSVNPSCHSVDIVGPESGGRVRGSDVPSEKPISVGSSKRREDSCKVVIERDEPCVSDNVKPTESVFNYPITVSDTTQYEFSKKIHVVSNVSDPGIDTCYYQGSGITNNSEQQQQSKQTEDGDSEIKGLSFFFLQQVLKLIFLTHNAELCPSKLDKSTARLAIMLGENSVNKSGKRLKYNQVPDETDIYFNEFLAVVSLCDQIVNSAKLELWSQLQDPVYVYAHFLVRQTVISSLERQKTKVTEETEIEHFKNTIEAVSKSWHKQGFHKTVHASRNLAQTLITNYVSSSGMNCRKVCSSILSLKRLENQLTRTLEEYATLVLRCWWSQKSVRKLIIKGHRLIPKLDWINARTDVATEKMVSCLPSAVVKIVNEEILTLTASNLCQDVILSVLHDARLQAQLARYENVVFVNEEEDVEDMIKDLEPVQCYLKYVTLSEKLKSKQSAENGYVQRYQYKHKNFAMLYLQNVTDSFFITEEAYVDKTLTENVLYELEWYVMHENTKVIPGALKGFMMFLLFCGTLFNMAYVFFTGSYLSVTQIKEWVTSLALCIAIDGLLLEPVCAIIIGTMDSRHKRRSLKNVTAQHVDV